MSRNPRGKRQPKRTILIVTNGQETELTYLKEIKKLSTRLDANIKVRFESGEPASVLKKLQRPLGDTSGYDEVWIVIDEDGHDRSEFLASCMKLCGKNQKWYAVISRPCFEVWLIAHYVNVRKYVVQGDAQKHFRKLIPQTVPNKQLPQDFPYNGFVLATGQCQLPTDTLKPLDQLPSSPGTAMPHLIDALRCKSPDS